MLSYQEENWESTKQELIAILPTHYQELALHKDKVPLMPNWEVYTQMAARNELLFVTVREEGKLIGYFLGFVGPALHYITCLTCHMDIFYIVPEARGNNCGWFLFKKVEELCKQRGVQNLVVGCKLHKDVSFLFEKLGYTEIERTYSAWLGD